MSRQSRVKFAYFLIATGAVAFTYQLALDLELVNKPKAFRQAQAIPAPTIPAVANLQAPAMDVPTPAIKAAATVKQNTVKVKQRKVAAVPAKYKITKHKKKNQTKLYNGKRLVGSVTVHQQKKKPRR